MMALGRILRQNIKKRIKYDQRTPYTLQNSCNIKENVS